MTPSERLAALEAFFEFVFRRVVIDGGDVEGGEALDVMTEQGLVKDAPYDPERHGEGIDVEPGDAICVRATDP